MDDPDKPSPPARGSVAIGAAFTLVLWLLALVLWSANDLSKPGPLPGALKILLLQTFVVGIAFSAVLGLAVNRAQRLPVVPCVAATAGAALFMGLAHGFLDALLVREYARAEGFAFAGLWRQFVGGLMPFPLLYLFYAAVLGLLRSAELGRRRERQLADARHAAQEARLAALRFQLNPHFLFNTLNAISSLIVNGRNEDAEVMTVRLSSFLRTSLEADMQGTVTLDEELATLHSYLDIEAVRFGERLCFDVRCPVQLLDAQVPSFLLQPLIENAVKYGVAPSRGTVTIAVEVVAHDGRLEITVQDDGGRALASRPAAGTGLGIANVRQRLAAHYGEAARLEALARHDGFTVQIAMPLALLQIRDAAE
ncbi:sensor histidine kinase [Novosphingobium soli]